MDGQFIDLLHLTRETFNRSIEVAMGRLFERARKEYPSIKKPSAIFCPTDQVIKQIFERRNKGWPIIAYNESSIVRSMDRGSPVNMYRNGQIGGLLDNALTNYTKLKLTPQDVTCDAVFLTASQEEKSAFIYAWGVLANTSGLKFDLSLDEIGLKIPIGVSLDESLSISYNEDQEVPYTKVQTSFVLKTFTGEAETVPAIHGTLEGYLASLASSKGPQLPLPSGISYRNPSKL